MFPNNPMNEYQKEKKKKKKRDKSKLYVDNVRHQLYPTTFSCIIEVGN